LNEAIAYLSKAPTMGDSRLPAVIDLRRAEAYLLQLENEIRRKKPNRRKYLALVENVHFALEHAQNKLVGLRKSVWWWTWLYEMQLELCVCLSRLRCCRIQGKETPAPCSRCSERGDRCKQVMEKGSRLIQWDVFRQARLTSLFKQYLKNMRDDRSPPEEQSTGLWSALNEANERLKDLLKVRSRVKTRGCALDPGVREYVEDTVAEVAAFCKARKRTTKTPRLPSVQTRR
jgi:hypothetical protein